MRNCRIGAAIRVAMVLFVGCAKQQAADPGTGAREAAHDFLISVVNQDWTHAYAVLHADSRRLVSSDQFAKLAQSYRQHLGFEPGTVMVRHCEENQGVATAHLTISGAAANSHRQFKDALSLKRTAEGWKVEISPNFGKFRQ